jgi:DNA-binding NtrC family response regulator
MPGSIDGMGLLAAVRKTSPKLPFIITSGHLQGVTAIDDGATHFFAKPYRSELLINVIRDELAKAP